MPDPQPLRPMRFIIDVERHIDEAFSRLIHEPWGKVIPTAEWQPAIDVYETETAYLIEVDLPGVPAERVTIQLEGNRITIRGSRESMAWVQHSGRTLRVERARGDFCRVVELEFAVDPDRIEKQFEEGILRVRLTKRLPDASHDQSWRG